MSIYGAVNTDLRVNRYVWRMPKGGKKPGSPKGVPKPLRRVLDPQFGTRLKVAMDMQPGLSVPDLTRKVGCTRAVIWKYLNGNSRSIDVHLFLDICEALGVSPRWLLSGTTQQFPHPPRAPRVEARAVIRK